jgi:hypothetical protein
MARGVRAARSSCAPHAWSVRAVEPHTRFYGAEAADSLSQILFRSFLSQILSRSFLSQILFCSFSFADLFRRFSFADSLLQLLFRRSLSQLLFRSFSFAASLSQLLL